MKYELSKFGTYEDDDNSPREMPKQKATDDNEKFINLDHLLDNYINMEVCLLRGEIELFRKVIGACLNKDGKKIGTPNANPFLNTVLYEVQFEDSISQAYSANLIAENMWGTTNDEGYHEDTLHLIVDVRFNSTVEDSFIYNK